MGLVRLLKKYSYKSLPLAELSLRCGSPRCGQGRAKGASFKNQGTKESKTSPKASYIQRPVSDAALSWGHARLQRRGQQPAERSSSTGSEASAAPFCLHHSGCFLVKKTPI